MKVLANASPLIFLAKIKLIDLLPSFCDQLIIPEGVISEIQKHPDEASQWLKQNEENYQVTAVQVPSYVHAWDLGKGESEVIASAIESKEFVVALDDKAARNCAISLNLNVIGTIGIILKMQQAKLLNDAVTPLIRLREQGFRIDDVLYQHALKIANDN
jgi:predicted nucleic acid-binding protein